MFSSTLPNQAKLSFLICRTTARRTLSTERRVSSTIRDKSEPRNFEPSKVYVPIVSRNATVETLTETFSKFGTVKAIRLGPARGSTHRRAHITFEKPEDAENALKSSAESPMKFDDLPLKVMPSVVSKSFKNTLFVCFPQFDEKSVRDLFEGFDVKGVRILPARGKAIYVDFNSSKVAAEALKQVQMFNKGFKPKEGKLQDTLVTESWDTSSEKEIRAIFKGIYVTKVTILPARGAVAEVQFDSVDVVGKALAKAIEMATAKGLKGIQIYRSRE